jgi:Domain of Unknown Function (DUF1080)
MLKKFILILLLICGYSVLIYSQHPKDNSLSAVEKKAGWKLLFDGKKMTGWRTYKNKESNSWEVAEGVLHCRANEKDKTDKRGDIVTVNQYDNFELSIEWKMSKAGNSGILYHVTEDHDGAYLSGPEYQLIDDVGFPEKLEEWQKTGADYAMYSATSTPTKPIGEFNLTKIVVNNGHVVHWLNGVKVVEFEAWTADWNERKAKGKWKDVLGYGLSRKGHICLQDHGSEVWFKNIKIKKL